MRGFESFAGLVSLSCILMWMTRCWLACFGLAAKVGRAKTTQWRMPFVDEDVVNLSFGFPVRGGPCAFGSCARGSVVGVFGGHVIFNHGFQELSGIAMFHLRAVCMWAEEVCG